MCAQEKKRKEYAFRRQFNELRKGMGVYSPDASRPSCWLSSMPEGVMGLHPRSCIWWYLSLHSNNNNNVDNENNHKFNILLLIIIIIIMIIIIMMMMIIMTLIINIHDDVYAFWLVMT